MINLIFYFLNEYIETFSISLKFVQFYMKSFHLNDCFFHMPKLLISVTKFNKITEFK